MPELRERLLRPREGWLSLALIVVMLLSLAWSVQSAALLDQLDFLVPVVIYAALLGALLALLPISVVFTISAGAVVGAAIVIWAVGGEYFPALGQLERAFSLRDDILGWFGDLVRTGYPFQLTPYALGLGVLTWTIGFIAAYTVYRHHRVIDGIVLIGIALITNMSATYADLFGHLVLFVAAALLLWLRASLVSRQESWQRRRVNENSDVPAAIMRSGILFAAGSVILAWVLTSVAVAAPLTSAWRNLDTVWGGVTDNLEGVFGNLTNPESRIRGTSFGSSFIVKGSWVSNDALVMQVASTRPYYMRTTTYDRYTGRGWDRGQGERRPVAAGEPLFPGYSAERPNLDSAYDVETLSISMEQAIGRNLFAPGFPIKAFVPALVYETGGAPIMGGLESANPIGEGQDYQVTAALSTATEAELAGAGTAYPDEIALYYLEAPGMTDRTRQLAHQIVTDAGATDPYFMAKALARYLSRDESFTYATTAPVPDDPDRDLVDFFLFDEAGRTGYCEYYATAMVVMARSLGIPARMAVGFAPGERTEDGTYTVRERNAHAWAEVFFPGYGWQIFEATKTIDPQFVRRSGGATATPLPPNQSLLDRIQEFDEELGVVSELSSFEPIEGGVDARGAAASPVDSDTRGGNALLIAALLLGAGLVAWIRLRRSERRWRFLSPGERTWQRLALAAGRAGVAQRPAETFYEYAGWLEDQIPTRRSEIRTIADGKVWQAYSGRPMGLSTIERLELAWHRLRLPMLWLTASRSVKRLLGRRRA